MSTLKTMVEAVFAKTKRTDRANVRCVPRKYEVMQILRKSDEYGAGKESVIGRRMRDGQFEPEALRELITPP